MSETSKGVRGRHMQSSYLDIGTEAAPQMELLGTGFKELNESPSAKTTSKKYVNDKSETGGVSGYEWKTSFNADQIRSITVIEFICRLGELEKTGGDVEFPYYAVDLDVPIDGQTNKFRARRKNIAVAVADFGDEDGEMTCEGEFLGQGDTVEGIFDTTTKTFTEGTEVI